MKQEDFTDALEEIGVAWQEIGQSIVIQSCPACGSQNWKVHLKVERPNEEEPFLGKCFAGQCQEGYSSFKYLLAAGMEWVDVMRVHGKDPTSSLRGLTPNVDELLEMVTESEPTLKLGDAIEESILANFFKISDWLDHPASIYAIKRGVPPEFYDRVLIDPETNAVVFVVQTDDGVAGYQRRFIDPVSPRLKTKTSSGFRSHQNLMHFPREGAKILVCEGPFTALAAWHFGYYGVCTFGSGVSGEQVKLISELSDRLLQPVGVAFDLDAAGQKGFAAIRSGMFWKNQEIFKVEVDAPDLPVGFDLNDAWQKGMKIREVATKWNGPAIPEIQSFLP